MWMNFKCCFATRTFKLQNCAYASSIQYNKTAVRCEILMFPSLLLFSPFYLVKGQCHEIDIFVEGLNILSDYALMVFKVFQRLFTTHTIINFSFASFKLLTNFEMAYPPQNSLFCDWSMFSSACCRENAQELTWHRRLPE
jgi:hypothetical protein